MSDDPWRVATFVDTARLVAGWRGTWSPCARRRRPRQSRPYLSSPWVVHPNIIYKRKRVMYYTWDTFDRIHRLPFVGDRHGGTRGRRGLVFWGEKHVVRGLCCQEKRGVALIIVVDLPVAAKLLLLLLDNSGSKQMQQLPLSAS